MKIEFYKKPSDKCLIYERINKLDARKQKKILKMIEKLKTENLEKLLKSEVVKKLKDNLFELRPHGYRLTFIVHKNYYLILTIFKKQGNKTPQKEFENAINIKKMIDEKLTHY